MGWLKCWKKSRNVSRIVGRPLSRIVGRAILGCRRACCSTFTTLTPFSVFLKFKGYGYDESRSTPKVEQGTVLDTY